MPKALKDRNDKRDLASSDEMGSHNSLTGERYVVLKANGCEVFSREPKALGALSTTCRDALEMLITQAIGRYSPFINAIVSHRRSVLLMT